MTALCPSMHRTPTGKRIPSIRIMSTAVLTSAWTTIGTERIMALSWQILNTVTFFSVARRGKKCGHSYPVQRVPRYEYEILPRHGRKRFSQEQPPCKRSVGGFPKEIPPRGDEDFSLRFISLAPGLKANGNLAEMVERYIVSLNEN